MLVAATCLSGCVTTQQRNARAKLRAERELGARSRVRVGAANPQVDVTRVALVRGTPRSVVVVQLRSRAATALRDLPIAAGLRGHGRHIHLNATADLNWFATHVPAIAAHGETTWVLSTRRTLPRGLRPYARVGRGSPAPKLPRLDAALVPGRPVRVRVRNPTAVPQTPLELYALAQDGGRIVGAGRASLPRLDSGAAATLRVAVVGSTHSVHVQAVPTIFR